MRSKNYVIKCENGFDRRQKKYLTLSFLLLLSFIKIFGQPLTTDDIAISDIFTLNPDMSDEFNTGELNTSKWAWSPNATLEYPYNEYNSVVYGGTACMDYTPDVISFESEGETSFLRLSIKEIPSECDWHEDGVTTTYTMPYKTGNIFGRHQQQKGYFEIRMRIPDLGGNAHKGISANAWLWRNWDPANGIWSEIDLAEINARHNLHTCNVHFNPNDGNDSSHQTMRCGPNNLCNWTGSNGTCEDTNGPNPFDIEGIDGGWHIYSAYWTSEFIAIYLDGKLINKTTLGSGSPAMEELNWIVSFGINKNQFNEYVDEGALSLPYHLDVDYIRTFSGEPWLKSVYDNQGDGPGVHDYPAMIGDVNGDGKDDLVFVGQDWSGSGLNIRTKFSNGDGSWSSIYDVLGDGPGLHDYPTMMGDVNGDGRDDLVFVGQGWSGSGLNIRTKFSNGDGSWSGIHDVLGDGPGVHDYPTMIGDVNGDGRDDLVFVGQDWSGSGLNIRTKFSNGDGSWSGIHDVLGDGPGVHDYPAMIGDVNGDGRDDLVFVGQDWSGSGLNIRTKFSNGDGSWSGIHDVLGDGPGVHDYPTMIGDVNGDGRDDLVFVGQDWSGSGLNIRTKFSNGDGTWSGVYDVLGDGPGVHYAPTRAGDFNGDCMMDLLFTRPILPGIMSQEYGCLNGSDLRIKLSRGTGEWDSDSWIEANNMLPFILIGDVNDNSKDDIVILNQHESMGLQVKTKFSNYLSEGCVDCTQGAVADLEFLNPDNIYHENSYYGNQEIHQYCAGIDKILLDGSGSYCEDNYFLEIVEFDLSTWTSIGDPLYAAWICPYGCTAPNDIDLSAYIDIGDLSPTKIYKMRLAVGAPWDAVDKFFSVVDCFGISEIKGKEETTAGMETESFKVKVYPNPTSDYVEIHIIESNSTEISQIEVYSLQGQKLKSFVMEEQVSRLDMGDLASGLYLIKVSKGTDEHYTKLIKQ